MPKLSIKHLLGRLRPSEHQTDYQSLLEESGSPTEEYARLISNELRRWGVSEEVATVEALELGVDEAGRQVVVGLVRLVGWNRTAVLKALIGLPLLERKVRKLLPATWLAEVTAFGGVWLNASAALQEGAPASDLRHLLMSLTQSPELQHEKNGMRRK